MIRTDGIYCSDIFPSNDPVPQESRIYLRFFPQRTLFGASPSDGRFMSNYRPFINYYELAAPMPSGHVIAQIGFENKRAASMRMKKDGIREIVASFMPYEMPFGAGVYIDLSYSIDFWINSDGRLFIGQYFQGSHSAEVDGDNLIVQLNLSKAVRFDFEQDYQYETW